MQLRYWRATRLSHEAVFSRTALKPVCALLFQLRNATCPSSTGLPVDSTQNTTSSDRSLLANKHLNQLASTMRPTLDSESGLKPDELPHDAKLQAGYIRYIRILPTKGPNEELCFETCIRRSLIDADSHENRFPETFSYNAISYSWGEPTPLHAIVVDGQERLIARDLWQFLQRVNIRRMDLPNTPSSLLATKDELRCFREMWDEQGAEFRSSNRLSAESWRDQLIVLQRERWPESWLWIDALCIDQADARERTHQVGIMAEIFGRAGQVISWLGAAYDDSQHAMTTLADYTSHESPSEDPILGQTQLSEAICSLCERQYWQRLWVFQELRHAKHIMVLCGEDMISWDQFRLLWRAILDQAWAQQ
jgi:hypothetical protein